METVTPTFATKIAQMVLPTGGPKTVVANFDFTGSDGTAEVDGSLLVEQNKIEYIQTIYVDNFDNPNDLIITTTLTKQRIVAPANTQGYYAILQPNPPKFLFQTTAGAFTVQVQFLNVPVQPQVWGPGQGGSSGALTDAELRASPVEVEFATAQAVTPTQPIGGAYTNRSIANLSGASEALMIANANRRILFIQNVSANNMGVNLIGGSAAIGSAGTITLTPGSSITLDNYPPTSAINIIGTAGDDVTAFEG